MKKSKFFEPLAVCVAGGQSIKAASSIVGCALQTAYHVSADSMFRSRVSELRSEVTTEAVGKLANAASQAVSTLVELMDVANDPSIRLNASKAILAALPTMTEFGELRRRVDEIENGNNKPRLAR